ncbi:hypothetical protein E2P81_ATG05877 [Venturia nashicola]|uniref:Uncharacterized protein n=1 Tax=Venturia nashicola TaxID=86259 RepID=A0A4Z1NS39_9PEZI|nr:hypothetical protein E6O75_ATG06023 [Venturia nashicola]TLD29583.1 hypothetical protein E2P81_ATG05877 [Venturia nashicola]
MAPTNPILSIESKSIPPPKTSPIAKLIAKTNLIDRLEYLEISLDIKRSQTVRSIMKLYLHPSSSNLHSLNSKVYFLEHKLSAIHFCKNLVSQSAKYCEDKCALDCD